ncbi:MAG: HAD hydrolase-like protein [Candidatus Dormibacteria bacterium]
MTGRETPQAASRGALTPLRAVLLDVDGTLMSRGQPIPGAVSTLRWLREWGLRMRLLTNIDSRTPETVCRELSAAGLEVEIAEIFTPVVAALRFLEQRPGERCHLLLSAELAARFAAHDAGEGRADHVLVGDCRELAGFAPLDAAFRRLMDGAGLLALQRGRWWQAQDGPSLDTGAFVALLEYASGQTARTFGKPSVDFFEMALADLGCTAAEALVVGDDPENDAGGARAVGAPCVLVRTGKLGTRGVEGDQMAVMVIDSIAALPALLEARRHRRTTATRGLRTGRHPS